MTDQEYMTIALKLAKEGQGQVNPNPMVGAVIVKNGVIIGQGYHEKYGGLHAELNALSACSEPAEGAAMYVTLEPCCHWGKTPPCTDAIIKNGIQRVIIGSTDPNPAVSGKGIALLQNHGISVTVGVLQQECDKLNRVFFHYMKTGMPYVILKYAMTMDGKITSYCGKSKWITGEIAREKVHRDRHRYSAIMVGVGTVIADDPLLTCRVPDGKNPVRIICDTHLQTPLESRIITTAAQVETIIATSCTDASLLEPLKEAGCKLLILPLNDGHVNLTSLMERLGKMHIDSVIIEGGSTLNWSALNHNIVHKVQAYLAPKLMGGVKAKTPIGGFGAESPQSAVSLCPPEITTLGEDILLESEVISCLPE